MSAIWGKIIWNGVPAQDMAETMSNCYRDRCRIDRFGLEVSANACIGCGIQYIYPEARREHLPRKDDTHGFIFSADIVLDNRRELLDELSLEEECADGEIAYQAYLKWGIDCVKKFYGLFTIAVWDYRKQTLYLANDHIAARCLYYYSNEEGVTFSTLLEPLLQKEEKIEINEMFLKDYLAAPWMIPTVVETETPYQGVYKLSAATILTITQTEQHRVTYWSPSEPLENCHCTCAGEYGAYFRKLLTTCVRDAIRGEEKRGIALSSGLDSSSVGSIAADLLKKENRYLYAYTYVPADTADKNTKSRIYDETEDVKQMIAMHENILPHFLCNHGESVLKSIEEGLQTLEIPYKAFVNYPSLREIYQEASKEGCTVMLSGQFGNSTISYGNIDPIFFDLYRNHRFLTLFRAMNGFACHMKLSRKKFFAGYLRYLHQEKKAGRASENEAYPEYPFASASFWDTYPLKERFAQGRMDLFSARLATQKKYQELLCVFPGSAYIGEWETKLGLKYGLLLRDPTKDRRMISFCYHLPYEYFAYQGKTKWLIRENMKDMLPAYLLDNWDRHGIQNSDWLRRVEADWEQFLPGYESVISGKAVERYVDARKLKKLLRQADFKVTELDASTAIQIFFAYVIALYLKRYGK